MRKQYLLWIIAVFGIVGVAYGGYLLIYHFNHGNGLSIPALLVGTIVKMFYTAQATTMFKHTLVMITMNHAAKTMLYIQVILMSTNHIPEDSLAIMVGMTTHGNSQIQTPRQFSMV